MILFIILIYEVVRIFMVGRGFGGVACGTVYLFNDEGATNSYLRLRVLLQSFFLFSAFC